MPSYTRSHDLFPDGGAERALPGLNYVQVTSAMFSSASNQVPNFRAFWASVPAVATSGALFHVTPIQCGSDGQVPVFLPPGFCGAIPLSARMLHVTSARNITENGVVIIGIQV